MNLTQTRFRGILWVVRSIICALKIFGLAPFFVGTKTLIINSRRVCMIHFRFSRIGLVYNILLSILVTAAISTLLYQFLIAYDFQSENIVSQGIDVTRSIAFGCTTCVIIISWTIGQKSAVRILNRLLDVEVDIFHLEKQPSKKKTITFLTLHLILNAVIWIAYWITRKTPKESDNYKVWFWNIVTSHSIYWFTVEYMIAVSRIAVGLETLNKNLLNLKEPCCDAYCSQPVNDCLQTITSQVETSKLAALRSLIKIRTKLSDISQEVEDFFSFPILCCIVCNYLGVVRISYVFITSPDAYFALPTFLMWMSVCLYPIVSLCAEAAETARQAKQTSLIVCKVLTSKVKRKIKSELEQFSLQLLHDNFRFSACGFSTLDFTLLNSIIGATMTYLVISLQFGTPADKTNN